MSLIKCTTCNEPLIAMGSRMMTLLGCGSPPGHDHDCNCVGRPAWCASGHRTMLGLVRRCNDYEVESMMGHETDKDGRPYNRTPACDWRGQTECSICTSRVMLDAWPDLPER